jgi:cyclophilin family peptidyl-prolyl cis-trans isomerase
VTLANLGFYDGLPINQVDPTQLLVVGSPNNDPSSDAGYTIPAELSVPVSLTVGSLAYIPAGVSPEGTPLSSSSQLIVALIAPPQEVGVDFSFFGQVTGGLDVLSKLAMTDTITSITIAEE